MRVVVFLSRFTFICNIAFLLFVFFSWMEARKSVKAIGDRLIEVPLAKNLIITLGFSAFFINIFMVVIYAVLLIAGRIKLIPRWLIIVNVIFLLVQFYYFFYFNF